MLGGVLIGFGPPSQSVAGWRVGALARSSLPSIIGSDPRFFVVDCRSLRARRNRRRFQRGGHRQAMITARSERSLDLAPTAVPEGHCGIVIERERADSRP